MPGGGRVASMGHSEEGRSRVICCTYQFIKALLSINDVIMIPRTIPDGDVNRRKRQGRGIGLEESFPKQRVESVKGLVELCSDRAAGD